MVNEIDIHGMLVVEAKSAIDMFINRLPKGIHEITIIHGYRAGSALQTYVRKQYSHKRCKRKMVSMNPGETILILKD